jgi:Zn finger protein HypA/HybF involved in hydrogenase expression
MTAKIRSLLKRAKNKAIVVEYKCQFCEEESPAKDWEDNKCPKCKRSYDPMLAQEMDD